MAGITQMGVSGPQRAYPGFTAKNPGTATAIDLHPMWQAAVMSTVGLWVGMLTMMRWWS